MADAEAHLFNPYRTQVGPGEWVEGFKEDTIHDALTKNPAPKGPPLVVQSPAASSPGSEGSTRDSDGQAGATPSSASPTPTDATCFAPVSPESPSTTTYAMSPEAERSGEAMTLSPDAEGRMRLRPPSFGLYVEESPTLQSGRPPSVFSAEGSRARTSPSPDNAAGSQEAAPACSSSSPASQTLFDPDLFSSRTYPGCSVATAVGTSESFLERWPTSGTAWDGGFSTAVSSECRSVGGACSSLECSLTGILQPPQSVPDDYSLSGRAARGILRRAMKRGRTLPSHLSAALEAVARTTTTDKQGG